MHYCIIYILLFFRRDCNLDLDFMKFCKPLYSFRRADDPNTNIAPGWNFRYGAPFVLEYF